MKYTIWIKKEVLDFIFSNGDSFLPKETGGVLIGYRASETEFVVTDIVGPGPKAIHGNTFFKPDQRYHKMEVASKYLDSGYTETYLGDWHTHPHSSPYLSDKDKKTVKKIALHTPARLQNPIMLVAAPPKNEYKIWVYEIYGSKKCDIYSEAKIMMF